MTMDLGCRVLDQAYRNDQHSDVQAVVTSHDLPDDSIAPTITGRNQDDDVTVAFEAERINNDHHDAIPNDDDENHAATQPDDTIWLVPRTPDAHTILDTHNATGHPDTTYADTTPPTQSTIDTPGLTTIDTIATTTHHLAQTHWPPTTSGSTRNTTPDPKRRNQSRPPENY